MLGKFFARRSARKYAERHKRLHVETDSVLQGDGIPLVLFLNDICCHRFLSLIRTGGS